MRKHIFTIDGEAIDAPPACPGVYRFFDQEGVLLYVGKSVDLRSRIGGHYAAARRQSRAARILSQVARIDLQLTAGEVGALLLENAAIKAEMPIYNRRQRRLRRMCTLVLEPHPDGFLRPVTTDFYPDRALETDIFGLFPNRHSAERAVRRLVQERQLCPLQLGTEHGRAPCFQYQIKRCRGACVGRDTAASHNARLVDGLSELRICAWPFRQPVLIEERACSVPAAGRPARQWHLVHHWTHLETFDSAPACPWRTAPPGPFVFDRDTYRIVRQAIARRDIRLHCAVSGRRLGPPERISGGTV